MTRPTKILVAYDGSTHSKKALEWAIDLSLQSSAQVIAVKVFETLGMSELFTLSRAGQGAKMIALIAEMQEADKKMMEEAAEVGRKRGVQIAAEILEGNVSAKILEYATTNQVDLIVTGTKGHGVLDELLMGSVTRNLVSLSHVPVLVVKD